MAVVVGVALLDRAGRVLAARRMDTGGWEFPGGKVEPGESEVDALVRECREELGVTVEVGGRVGPDVPISDHWLLRVRTGRVPCGEPVAREHAELRWLRPDELDGVDWLPADRPVVAALRARLARG